MRTRVRGPESLELALEITKKERLTNGYFFDIWFRHIHLSRWMILVLLDNLL